MLLHLPLIEKIIAETEAGRRVALCAVVATRGSAPQSPGAMLVVDEGMNTVGTLGGGCVEAEVRKRAFDLLTKGESSLLPFKLDHDYGWDDGLICGGGMDIAVMSITGPKQADQFAGVMADMNAGRQVHVELRVRHEEAWQSYRVLVEAEPKLVIAGAGHVGAQLARLCVALEFDVTVIDDRADCANAERLPPPIHIVVGDIEQSLRAHPIGPDTYVVIVTRGHRHDEQALSAVIESKARYLGMIGSRRKIKLIFDDLKSTGLDAGLLDRVHAPIGLDINAVTVPEIAVSIAAQLIAVRRVDRSKLVEGPFATAEGAQNG